MLRFDGDIVRASFRKMPTCQNDVMKTEDVPKLLADLGYDRTPEQLAEYIRFWEDVFDGNVYLDLAIAVLDKSDDISKVIKVLVNCCDKDKSGFISETEFKACIRAILAHSPEFPRVDYEQFLKEADKNQDGKVSIEETVNWIMENDSKLKFNQ